VQALVRQELPMHVLTTLAARLQADAPLQEALLSFCIEPLPHWLRVEAGSAARPYAALTRLVPAVLSYERWSGLLAKARLGRPQVLAMLGELTGCAVQLTGRQGEALEIARAVQEVCAWRP
jgi:hypothetical protein